MLLDDSFEFEPDSPTQGAELISMKNWHDIRLSEIWVPVELLPNRQTNVELNLDKPIPFHTLEKVGPLADSLSVYSESDVCLDKSNFGNEEQLLDSLEEIFSGTQNTFEYSIILNETKCVENELSHSDEVFHSESDSILGDYLEDLCISDSDTENLISNPTDNNEITEESTVTSFSVNSTQESLKLNSDLASNCKTTFIDDVNTVILPSEKELYSPVVKDLSDISNEDSELYFSADSQRHSGKLLDSTEKNEKNFSIVSIEEQSKLNFELDPDSTFEKDFSSEIADCNNSDGKAVSSDLDLNVESGLELCLSSDFETHLENILPTTAKDVIDDKSSTSNENTFKPLVISYGSDDFSTENLKLLETDGTFVEADESLDDKPTHEEIVNYPISYQRPKNIPTSDLNSDKPKHKKDKRSRKKNLKSIPLDNFFVSESEAQNIEPEVDEFLEHIIRQKHERDNSFLNTNCLNHIQPVTVYPSLPVKPGIEFVHGKNPDMQQSQKCSRMDTSFMEKSTCSVKEDKSYPEVESFGNHVRITIENIPIGVDEETVKNIVLTYGSISRLILRRNGNTLKAELTMDLEDPDWIIEGLNGSQPFGVSSGEVLRCYKRC